ncbi:hypothetical protein [Hymenobacter lapidarius]|uniref:hypothetical protein n=1 Tax=Hymenobacter lapidarius TaxID=1908237 RepID=UPI000A54EA3D|nr:hypothetical protein [Hymenobacter lapidarius]
MSKALTTAEFIAKAQAVHGVGKYGYEKVVYVNGQTKVVITCSIHGFFEQRPSDHGKGIGCRFCGQEKGSISRSLDTHAFIARAKETHGHRYDYSKTIYIGNSHNVAINCPEHGKFEQKPSHHMKGSGCPACAGVARIDTPAFIARAQAAHGDRYDYSITVYAGRGRKLTIVCPEHGEFEQLSKSHMNGNGCPSCAIIANSHSTASFIARAQAAHENRYDYSKTVYTGRGCKVAIMCPKHGAFERKARNHLEGSGCPMCGEARRTEINRLSWIARAKNRICYLYLLRIFDKDEVFYKAGVTSDSVKRRFVGPQALNNYSYEVLALHKSTNAAAVWEWEQSILETFSHLAYVPKRPFGGATECFSSCEEILAIFPL